jgi:hypothetical protein
MAWTTRSPLLEVAMSYVSESLNPDGMALARRTIADFIKQKLSHAQACKALSPILGSSDALTRIRAILEVTNDPIPTPADDRPAETRAKQRHWSSAEDARLLAGIHRFGLDAWQSVATVVGNGRSKAQCAQRWTRGLDPKLRKCTWTAQEDRQLVMLVLQHGPNRWTRIANEIGNRCDVQCRYRFKHLQKDDRFFERFGFPSSAVAKRQGPKQKGAEAAGGMGTVGQQMWLMMQPNVMMGRQEAPEPGH